MGNVVGVRSREGELKLYKTGKVNVRLQAGEAYVIHSGGGGGFGDPKKRKRASILKDIEMGYVSLEKARETYQLVLSKEEEKDLSLKTQHHLSPSRS